MEKENLIDNMDDIRGDKADVRYHGDLANGYIVSCGNCQPSIVLGVEEQGTRRLLTHDAPTI